MSPTIRGVVCLVTLLATTPSFAQHEHHTHSQPVQKPAANPETLFSTDMRRMTGMVPVDPMERSAGWHWMTAGLVRFGYNRQGGERGDEGFESTNWLMLMAHHDLGPGRVTFMMMNSLEEATLDEPGSPQLFQTGETFEGEPLVDYQHPHDFFMNLSATYRASLSTDSAVWLQAAPVGEPALGPVAFMHRASSGDNPSAPLGHHWQDATHITFNVVTFGAGWNRVTAEASAFHGQEPDEDRWEIEGGEIDSYSGRVAIDLPRRWSVQGSYGDLNDHHTYMPGDVKRTTASLHYGAGEGPVAASFVWGRNDEVHGVSDSFLAEYAHQLAMRHQVFARFEWVEKDEELLATREHVHHDGPESLADVTALTLGYFHSGTLFAGLGMGGDATVYLVPSSLEDEYGGFPVSVHIFIRARWMQMPAGHAHH